MACANSSGEGPVVTVHRLSRNCCTQKSSVLLLVFPTVKHIFGGFTIFVILADKEIGAKL